MVPKSRLMNMSGESEPELEEDYAGEEMEDESDYMPESDYAGMPESPDVEEPMMGINAMHRQALEQANLYYNPVADGPEIEESERERLNPSSDPYAESMGMLGDNTDYDLEYRKRMMFKDEAIQTLQSKAQARALATAKFQQLATNKK